MIGRKMGKSVLIASLVLFSFIFLVGVVSAECSMCQNAGNPTPQKIKVTISGVQKVSGYDYTDFQGTYILNQRGACDWYLDDSKDIFVKEPNQLRQDVSRANGGGIIYSLLYGGFRVYTKLGNSLFFNWDNNANYPNLYKIDGSQIVVTNDISAWNCKDALVVPNAVLNGQRMSSSNVLPGVFNIQGQAVIEPYYGSETGSISSGSSNGGDSGVSGSSGDSGGSGSSGSGSTTQPSLEPGVKMYLDPTYIAKTEAERGFRPSEPFTPFDDVICELNITHSNDYSSRTFLGKLITQDNTKVVNGILSYSYTQGNRDYYSWKVKGWQEGWTNANAIMEKIIEDKEIICNVKISGTAASSTSEVVSKEAIYPVSTCVHLSGKDDAKFPIVYMEGKSIFLKYSREYSFRLLQVSSRGDYGTGFSIVISPFKEFKSEFSQYFDLVQYDDSKFKIDDVLYQGKPRKYFSSEVGEKLKRENSCVNKIQKPSTLVFYNYLTYRGYAGSKGGGTIFLSPDENSYTFMHELGHSFCGLLDEYYYNDSQYTVNFGFPNGEKNCVKNPEDFGVFGDKTYNNPGCSEFAGFFRSSVDSLMKTTYPKMNVISCAFCLSVIKGAGTFSNTENLRACMNLDTIKPGAECFTNIECVKDSSENGCKRCSSSNECEILLNNECNYNNVGKEVYGACSKEGKCQANKDWECIQWHDCPSKPRGDRFVSATACTNHKCIYPA